jgi:hypothetical protein
VQTLVVLTACFAVPAVRRFERRRPFELAAGLSVALLVFRFDLVTLGSTPEPLLAPHRVAWLFALGWAAQRADSNARRVLVSSIAVTAVPGFFDEPLRDAVVLVGLLALVWVRTLSIPRHAVRVIGVLASASLYIYLTHFQVYLPMLERGWSPLAAVTASIVVGVVVGTAVTWLTRRPRRQVSGVSVDSSRVARSA